jgi:hypothetical protein
MNTDQQDELREARDKLRELRRANKQREKDIRKLQAKADRARARYAREHPNNPLGFGLRDRPSYHGPTTILPFKR